MRLVIALSVLALAPAAQSLATINPIQDTYVTDAQPTTNYGASADIWFGRGSFFGLGNVRTLVQFDYNQLPHTRVRKATFSAFQYSSAPAAGGLTCRLHRATAPWFETLATWSQQPSFAGTTYDTASVGDSFFTGWISWDATQLVQEHLDGTHPNEGFFFKMSSESAGASRLGYFRSREYGGDPLKQLKLDVELYDLDLVLTQPVAGQNVTLSSFGNTPGAPIFIGMSVFGTGTTPIPGLGITSDLALPFLLVTLSSDGAGSAGFTSWIPPGVSGFSFDLQAVALGKTSNVVSATIL